MLDNKMACKQYSNDEIEFSDQCNRPFYTSQCTRQSSIQYTNQGKQKRGIEKINND